jgi:hypothetical protein
MSGGRMEFSGSIAEALHHYEKTRPRELASQSASLVDGPKIRGVRMMSSDSEGVDICVTVESPGNFPKIRLVVALIHSVAGPLFAISSFRDLSWVSLSPGRAEFQIELRGFKLQAGTCRCELSLRGEQISDIYDLAGSSNELHITEPKPNYEGFGINGVIVPEARWQIVCSAQPPLVS